MFKSFSVFRESFLYMGMACNMQEGGILKRGQAGIEYVILVGVLLVFLIPTIYYSLNEANRNVKFNQVENAVRRLAKAADSVHAIGPGSIEIITITLPDGVQDFSLDESEVSLQVSGFGGLSDVHYKTSVPLVGKLPLGKGTYTMRVASLKSGEVNITTRE